MDIEHIKDGEIDLAMIVRRNYRSEGIESLLQIATRSK